MSAVTGQGSRRRRDASEAEVLKAAQAALAAEHAAVYGYGVVGGRIGDDRLRQARDTYAAHRARRDALQRTVRDLGGTPVAAAAAYALPFPVPDAAAAVRLAAVRLAAELEHRVAAVYADLVRSADGTLRREAAAALREAAVRAVRWRGGGVAFPGLAERTAPADPSASPSGAAGAL
ncbi:ferritin-like domain-containing protein [Streptomyces sp. XD-27]|uniref:ferritin-like domain-containing protein n=1 Tax=Streptomyces sp. XD-27 TaxID=3062779 RepID=UPI0026F47911|nr:ferritin-like domain-containing protein [Streptomyces sp. XD-27]WKX72894.1 ferritin-like domain-containing protein [Streptomyces sp. XD-27]